MVKTFSTKRLAATLVVLLLLTPSITFTQATPVPVAYSVVCDDYSMKLVIEQKLISAIQANKGFVVDPSGKAELKLLLAVTPIKRRKEKTEETTGLSIATLGLRGSSVIHFENALFSPDGYEQGLIKLTAHILGRK